jgi:hypothetical protein
MRDEEIVSIMWKSYDKAGGGGRQRNNMKPYVQLETNDSKFYGSERLCLNLRYILADLKLSEN